MEILVKISIQSFKTEPSFSFFFRLEKKLGNNWCYQNHIHQSLNLVVESQKIHQIYSNVAIFGMRATIKKVHAEYHEPVGIRKTMDSSTAKYCYKLSFIWFSLKLLILEV